MSLFKTLVSTLLLILTIGVIRLWSLQGSTQKDLKNLNSQNLPIKVLSDSKVEADGSGFSSLEEANASLQASISGLLSRITQLENKSTPAIGGSVINTSTFQPQDIFLGSASSNKKEWTDTGLETSLSSSNYPANVKVYFEAGLAIIGGEAWVRLKNKTTGAVISSTELFHNNDSVTWKTSPTLKLHSGNNVYVVQLKSTSGETINLAGARIKITQ